MILKFFIELKKKENARNFQKILNKKNVAPANIMSDKLKARGTAEQTR